jgi:hypothetical protein
MKLLSFAMDGRESWGAVVGDRVADLGSALPHYPSLADFVGSADFSRRDALATSEKPGPKLADITYLPSFRVRKRSSARCATISTTTTRRWRSA